MRKDSLILKFHSRGVLARPPNWPKMDRRDGKFDKNKDSMEVLPETKEESVAVPSFNVVAPPVQEKSREQEREAGQVLFTLSLRSHFSVFYILCYRSLTADCLLLSADIDRTLAN